MLRAVFLSLALAFAPAAVTRAIADELPAKVPGNTVANQSETLRESFFGRLKAIATEKFGCDAPRVLFAEVEEFSPWDTSRNPPELTGPIHEHWSVDVCGQRIEVYFAITPVRDGSGRVAIAAAYRVSNAGVPARPGAEPGARE